MAESGIRDQITQTCCAGARVIFKAPSAPAPHHEHHNKKVLLIITRKTTTTLMASGGEAKADEDVAEAPVSHRPTEDIERRHRYLTLCIFQKQAQNKRSPSDFLKSVLGRPVRVRLNSGVEYRGKECGGILAFMNAHN